MNGLNDQMNRDTDRGMLVSALLAFPVVMAKAARGLRRVMDQGGGQVMIRLDVKPSPGRLKQVVASAIVKVPRAEQRAMAELCGDGLVRVEPQEDEQSDLPGMRIDVVSRDSPAAGPVDGDAVAEE